MNTKPEENHHQATAAPSADTKPEENHHQTPAAPSADTKPEENHQQTPAAPSADNKPEKWGTHVMGQPTAPSAHPNNQKAALWSAEEHHQPQHPYVQHSPIDQGKQTQSQGQNQSQSSNPKEPVIHDFNTWTHKAETLGRNIWQNLKTGPSLSDAVYGKVGLTTKVVTGGGFEALYKQTFGVTDPDDKLKKTFACYLSTATGPVAGTMYLTNVNITFCSDRPLSFAAPSGQVSWSYYKVVFPLAKISSINPITLKENPAEKYIQIATVDNHDFWFMGFVNYDKATNHLSQSFSDYSSMPAADHHHGPPAGPQYDNAPPPMPAADHHQVPPAGPQHNDAPPHIPAADNHHGPPAGPQHDDAPPHIPAADNHQGPPGGLQHDDAPPPMPAADHHQGPPAGPRYDDAPPHMPAADNHHGPPSGPQYDNAAPHMPAADNHHSPPAGPQYDNAAPPMLAADNHHGPPAGPQYDNAAPPMPAADHPPPMPAADHHHGPPAGPQYDNAPPPMPAADHH